MANEMRDRLLELIFQGDEKCSEQDCRDCKHHGKDFCGFEHIADYLIENGVVVPPCKVGDEIWYITTSYMTKIPKVQSGRVEKIIITENGIDLIADNYVSKLTYGKRSFLTKAEAEQKLKEMRGE